MDVSWLNFVSKNADDLTALIARIASFKKDMRERVQRLGSIVDISDIQNIRQWFYREQFQLFDVLVYDIKRTWDLPIAIDTVVSAEGWRDSIFCAA